jgi:hypothetical protein
MTHDEHVTDYVQRVLDRLEGVRRERGGWKALCPCPGHGDDGDQRQSLRVTIGDEGRILLNCRVGCKTDAVLEAAGLDWPDLFPGVGDTAAAVIAPREVVIGTETGDGLNAELLDQAYVLLLDALPLNETDREGLRRRGLPDGEIGHRGYRTLRNVDRGGAARKVVDQLGDDAFLVPGFVNGRHGPTIDGTATGLLVPVRGLTGQIQALKVRRVSEEPKYLYITSNGGRSPGAPSHVPLGIGTPTPILRVTEGELKADVATVLSDMPTIGVPGVTQWRSALPLIRELAAETVIVSFDAPDVHSKLPVFEQAKDFCQALEQQGFKIELEDWDDETQGN